MPLRPTRMALADDNPLPFTLPLPYGRDAALNSQVLSSAWPCTAHLGLTFSSQPGVHRSLLHCSPETDCTSLLPLCLPTGSSPGIMGPWPFLLLPRDCSWAQPSSKLCWVSARVMLPVLSQPGPPSLSPVRTVPSFQRATEDPTRFLLPFSRVQLHRESEAVGNKCFQPAASSLPPSVYVPGPGSAMSWEAVQPLTRALFLCATEGPSVNTQFLRSP